MTGCLKIKNDTYYAVLNLKVGDKYKQKWISTKLKTKGNKRKATEILNALIAEYEEKEKNSENSNPSDILFTDYAIDWLERKKGKVEKVTWDGYYAVTKGQIIPYFKPLNLSLGDIKPKHIMDYYDSKFRYSIRKKSKGLSFNTVKQQGIILKNILNQAYLEELIDRNPASRVPLPKRDNKETRAKFLNEKEANELLKIFSGNKIQPIIFLTLCYGLRRGEVLGLKWSAIDFKNNKLKINHTITQSYQIEAKDKTKTSSSKREYTLLPEVKKLLSKIKEEQKNHKKLLKKDYNDSDYIFTWPNGDPYKPNYITVEFKKVLDKNNFQKMRFHDLRHSCASILYDKKWQLKDIQTWLGHANIQTTANIYTHVSNSRKEILAKDIQNTFSIAI